MYFWKIDEESIYCLINASEIRDMGYDIKELSGSHDLMGKFLEEIVRNSFQYIKWNADNGIQTYIARALPAGQFLLTISCTFIDVAIDRDLDQIRAMTEAIGKKITKERIDEIYGLEGEEKERAFESLARDLHAICSGEEPDSWKSEYPDADRKDEYPDADLKDEYPDADLRAEYPDADPRAEYPDADPRAEYPDADPRTEYSDADPRDKYTDADRKDGYLDANPRDDDKPGHSRARKHPEVKMARKGRDRVYLFRYPSFKGLTAFCAGLGSKFRLPSVLYRSQEDYVLEVTFPRDMRKDEVLYCVMAGEEYGAQVKIDKYDSNYLKEHGTKVIGENAISILQSLY